VKKSPEEQKHFTQRRKGLEGAKKTGQFFFARHCVLAPWRELFDFLTRSCAVGYDLPPVSRRANISCTLQRVF
jgi:hypothetical protein